MFTPNYLKRASTPTLLADREMIRREMTQCDWPTCKQCERLALDDMQFENELQFRGSLKSWV